MLPRAVLDSTVLVSAFLTPGGVADIVVQRAIVACAVVASVSHIVTRDDDVLSMGTYEGIALLTPEDFLVVLRGQA